MFICIDYNINRVKNLKSFFVIFTVTLIFPLIVRYVFVQHNQYEQIPLILRFLDKNYLVNDWFVNISSRFSPRFFFILISGNLAKMTSLPIVYLLFFMLTGGLIAFATFNISKKIFKSNISAILTTVTLLYGQKMTLGNNDDVLRDIDPAKFAFGLVFFAYWLLLSEKFLFAAIIFSFSSYIHPLIGFEAPFVFYFSLFLATLYTRSKKSGFKKNLLKIFKSVCLYLLLSSFSLYTNIQYIFSESKSNIPKGELFDILGKVSLPHHYMPSTWPISVYLKFAGFIILYFIFYFIYSKRLNEKIKNSFNFLFLIIFTLCVTGFFFTQILPVYFMMIMQFFRLTNIVFWAGAIIIYGGCFSISQIFRNIPNYIKYSISAIPFIIAGFDRIIVFSPGSFIFLLLTLTISILLTRSKKVSACYLLVFLSVFNFALVYRHYQLSFNLPYPFPTPETDLALWVKARTKEDKIFLVPPGFFRFRLTAQRAIVVDWITGSFSDSGQVDWITRIIRVSGLNDYPLNQITEQKVYEGYNKMDKERVLLLKQQYKFDYLVVEKKNTLPFEEIFQSSYYIIYKI